MKGIKRDVAVVVILTIVTCGIYSLYWMYVTHEEVNAYLSEQDLSGALVVLLSLITCGIYGWIWYYQLGQKIQKAQIKATGYGNDDSVLYLILAIFGFSIVSQAIGQHNLNKVWENA
ncbi:MAG: DUF4234 domain-containing protein [Cellulosilyticaceae bacterium]